MKGGEEVEEAETETRISEQEIHKTYMPAKVAGKSEYLH